MMNHNNPAESVQGSHAVRPGFIDGGAGGILSALQRFTAGTPDVPDEVDVELVFELPSFSSTATGSLIRNRATHALRLQYPASPEDIASVLFECQQLSIKAEYYLSDRRDREACLDMIASVARRGLLLMKARILCEAAHQRGSTAEPVTDDVEAEEHSAPATKNDSESLSRERDAKALDSLRNQLEVIDQFLISTAQLKAIHPYMVGILLGTIVLIAGFLFYVNSAAKFDSLRMPYISLPFAAAYYCGVAGAILSVLQRFTTGTLNLDHRLQKGHFVLLGATRPIIGATFGGITYIFIMSALVPITVPGADEVMKQVYFLGGLAVLAGFSERFAQGVLATAEGKAQAGISSVATQEGTIRLEPRRS